MARTTVLILAVVSLHSCLSCDPQFCATLTPDVMYCDLSDNASYYMCDNGRAKHFTCTEGLVFDGQVCVWPSDGACVPNPVSDGTPGKVVDGYCESTGNDPAQGTNITETWRAQRRSLDDRKSCSAARTLVLQSVIACAVQCLQSTDCSDFTYVTSTTREHPSHECLMLTCSTGFPRGGSTYFENYKGV